MGELHPPQVQGKAVVQEAFAKIAATLESAIHQAAPQRQDAAQLCIAAMAVIAGLRTLQRAELPLALRLQAAQKLAEGLTR